MYSLTYELGKGDRGMRRRNWIIGLVVVGAAGWYLWGVYGYSGSGTYHFWKSNP